MGLGFPMGQSRWLDIQMGEKVSEQRERGTISFTGSESSRRGDPQICRKVPGGTIKKLAQDSIAHMQTNAQALSPP